MCERNDKQPYSFKIEKNHCIVTWSKFKIQSLQFQMVLSENETAVT